MIFTTGASRTAGKLLLMFGRLLNLVNFAFEIMWAAAVPSLFVVFYTFLICYVTVLGAMWGLGVFVWFIPVGFLSPAFFVWYKIMERRYRAYLALMTSTQPMDWNTDAVIEGWLSLTRAKRREKKR